MEPGDKAKRMRIYISSTDKLRHTPLYEEIVFAARKSGLAGATVQKGIMGFGASSKIYSNKNWELTEKVPLIIEIIDAADKIDSFYEVIKPFLEEAGKGRIITVEETSILIHQTGKR